MLAHSNNNTYSFDRRPQHSSTNYIWLHRMTERYLMCSPALHGRSSAMSAQNTITGKYWEEIFYLRQHPSNTLLERHRSLLHTSSIRTHIPHLRLNPPITTTTSATVNPTRVSEIHLPRTDNKSNQLRILKVDLANHVIDRHLRHAVGRGGQREGFHVTDTCDSG